MTKRAEPATAYLALGSNMGEREQLIKDAIGRLGNCGVKVLRVSKLIETAPYGVTDQPAFLNCALEAETSLSPAELLAATMSIEKALGRVRLKRWGPRVIDIDIIFYGSEIIGAPGLTVPHPDMQNRTFVLGPLCELNPAFVHPALKVSLQELLRRLTRKEQPPQDK